ncbi:glutathione S-transferase family protein [Desulfurispira natronophila]|uniref:Putative glutathione S-transferase n=1 Tax=Desulfurispira natronophila TaxID=682562 RepID=A0A7W8DG37_9BACT|nr:glutathione S-transferase family protein [Desulfurispira natronophila]MBB5020969.1 putative glutathione S-transferase [Desulfurispira natronophila]
MGLLVNGKWHDQWYDTKKHQGRFVREGAQFRNWVTVDGKPGPSGTGGFTVESNRYHLYVSYACPWAHRTLIMRQLKGLNAHIGVTTVHPHMLSHGWEFRPEPEPLYGLHRLYELYIKTMPDYTGRVTVPILWDQQRHVIVNNESSEILRMLNYAFSSLATSDSDFYPESLREQIDAMNEYVYHNINNGVYRCGFATSQEAYEEAFNELFSALDSLETRLGKLRYLTGNIITEADWRLFTTLIRFDAVYVGHFKTNRNMISDYPHLSGYLRELYQIPGIRETVCFDHIKQHYYYSHEHINPHRIVPLGPELDLDAPHNRSAITCTVNHH